jgi:hypothetical protein
LVCPVILNAGNEEKFVPAFNPTLQLTEVSGKIDIDGVLDDPGWQGAAIIEQFIEFQPGDQTKPPVDTKVYVTYDNEFLYVAFVCYDDPSEVRATLSERDRWSGDDAVAVFIDTYGEAEWAYKFFANPYGIQEDNLWSRTGDDDNSYDLVWESAGKITDSGYQVELAIPFSSLRFPNRENQVWKIDFCREHPRESYRQYAWSAYDRNEPCEPCQWGTVTGIENVQSGRGIEVIPTFLGYQASTLSGGGTTGSPFEFVSDDPKGEPSLFARYAPASNTTLEAGVNPDFSQVESDAAQIDVNTTFALFYPEKRPFFLEGSDIFSTWTNTVYTRSINDPQIAAKMISRLERTTFAYLGAQDETTPIILPFEESSAFIQTGKSFSNIARARRTYGDDSYLGFIMTDRRLDGGGSGSLLSVDGQQRMSQNFRLQWQLIGSHTEEPKDTSLTAGLNDVYFDGGKHTAGFDGESFSGHTIVANLEERSRYIDMDLTYWERSPTFRADNGFEPRNNWRRTDIYLAYTFYHESGLLERIIPSMRAHRIWNFDGELKNARAEVNVQTQLSALQISTHTRYMRESETFGGVYFDNLWKAHNCFHSTPMDLISFGVGIDYEESIARRFMVKSRITSSSGWVDIKPVDRLLIENWFNYTRGHDVNTDDQLFEGYIVRSRLNIQILRELSMRLVVEYDDFSKSWNMAPLMTYRINPFSVFYIGSTLDWNHYNGLGEDGMGSTTRLSSRQYFMKLQYLFQI